MLREKYGKDGFELVAFPANQFGCQAPGTSEMEREYAWRKFGFEFPVMDKIAVKDKPGRCKGIDPASYEEFRDDPDAILTAPLVNDATSSAPIAPVYSFLKQPPFDGEIVVGTHGGRGYEHCFNGYLPDGTVAPNGITRELYVQKFLPRMAARWAATAPPGASMEWHEY